MRYGYDLLVRVMIVVIGNCGVGSRRAARRMMMR